MFSMVPNVTQSVYLNKSSYCKTYYHKKENMCIVHFKKNSNKFEFGISRRTVCRK